MRSKSIRKAARANGIAVDYHRLDGKDVPAVEKIVQKLLVELADPEDFSIPFVIVCWNGFFPNTWLWADRISPKTALVLIDEENKQSVLKLELTETIKRANRSYRIKLSTQEKIDFGYYETEFSGKPVFIISSPKQLETTPKSWGVFAPTYAIRSKCNQGIGGYHDLKKAARFVRAQGGDFIGTLPLLPVFHEQQKYHSPYSPVSRFFWDEIYLDINDLPNVSRSASIDFSETNSASHVNYKKVYALKKKIISEAAKEFFTKNLDENDAFKIFRQEKPFLDEYCKFQATNSCESFEYHLYAQYACHVQMSEFSSDELAQLYLDYPAGVHPDGFDAKIFSSLFLKNFTVGAPPDALSAKGQNWGFCPFHPHALLKDRFRYIRATLDHYFRYARMLRLDHVMGFYRLYCIPKSADGTQGIYLHYPFQALLAVLCLETWRHKGILIGENLGTVPKSVNIAMEDHKIIRMWISQFNIQKNSDDSFKNIEPDMIAALNTHDMAPFESFRKNQSILSEWQQPLETSLKAIASSPAQLVMVGMEDMWKETMPQNIPGTLGEYPNWSKKFSVPIEDWEENPDIKNCITILNEARGH